MIFFLNANGDLLKSLPETVYQGSANADEIYIVAPINSKLSASIAFELPNGDFTTPVILTPNSVVPVDNEEIPNGVSVWYASLSGVITQYYGNVNAQVTFYSSNETKQVYLTSQLITINIGKGVIPTPPETPTDNAWQQILSALSAIYQSDNLVTSIQDIGEDESVTYDSTDGITLKKTEQWTFADNSTRDIETEREMPIISGDGVNIDVSEDGKKVVISINSDIISQLLPLANGTGEKSIVLVVPDGATANVATEEATLAVVFGSENTATNTRSLTIGNQNTNNGSDSFVLGLQNTNNASMSIVCGQNNSLTAPFIGSTITLGTNNVVSASRSVVLGYNNKAEGFDNLVLGQSNNIINVANICAGNDNSVSSFRSCVCGYYNTTSTPNSLVCGQYNSAITYNSLVCGQYNYFEKTALFIVGNGVSDTARANAFVVMKDNRAKVYGEPTENNDVVRLADLSTKLKTIFGNQSIYGSGNIDLYEHDIVITGTNIAAYLTCYSSKNTNIDSLTDLKTICGSTFVKSCTGAVNGVAVMAITESNLLLIDGNTQLLSGVTFTDTVTTI